MRRARGGVGRAQGGVGRAHGRGLHDPMGKAERLGRAGGAAVMGLQQPPEFLGSMHGSGVRIVPSSSGADGKR